MAKQVSHSLLDPWLTRPTKALYPRLRIPTAVPSEAIVVARYNGAITGAVGFALASSHGWEGLLAAAGVFFNHSADLIDGTHVRVTDQCRNGGELIDHFVDPSSFCYWVAGIAYSVDCMMLGVIDVIFVYATAVLTSIITKTIGEFMVTRFGTMDFKTLVIVFALLMATITGGLLFGKSTAIWIAFWFLATMTIAGMVQMMLSLLRAIHEVNTHGVTPDKTEWENR